MKITKKILKQLEACEDGIIWAEKNGLLPFDSDNISKIKGDYKGYVVWLKENLINSTYDESKNELIHKCLNGLSWEKTFDKNGNLLSYKDSTGYFYKQTFDEKGNELTYKDSDGEWWEKTFDEKGNVLTYKASEGDWWEKTYDCKGCLLYTSPSPRD